jgi:hypothetical protein
MSGCGVTISDIWSVSHNQAGLAYLEKPMVGLYHERRFLIKELSFSSLAAVIPTKPGSFGFVVNYFGFSKYYDTKLGFAFSHRLGEKIAGGIQLDYFNTYMYGSESNIQRISFELGVITNPAKNLNFGFHLFNPFPRKLKHNSLSGLSSTARLGFSYFFYEKVLLTAEAFKKHPESIILKTGIEYIPVKQIAFRFGISTEPSSFSFGLGYYLKKLWTGIAFTNHQVLGVTPHFDIGFKF